MENEQKQTIFDILWQKVLDYVKFSQIKDIFRIILLILISILITYCLTYPISLVGNMKLAIVWNNYILLKGTFSFLLVFNFGKIRKFSRWIRKPKVKCDTIIGIPAIEILDHLFESKSFKILEIQNKFNIPKRKVEQLGCKLEEVGILIRGDKNARILNDDYSRSDITKILSGESIKPLIRKKINKGFIKYTSNPSMPEVRKRLSDTLNEPIFKTRNLA